MALRALALAAAVALGWGAGAACAAPWGPVPGAAELDIDMGSIQQQRTRVLAWVRWPGRGPLANELTAQGTRTLRIYRTAHLTEFDCSRRTVRALATNAYNSAGQVLYMSSLPGATLPVSDGDMAWAYAALCEAVRSGGRG